MPHIKERTADAAESPFLPTGTGNKCYLPCLPGSITSKPGGGEDEAFAKAILSSAKCRVMVGKSIIPCGRNSIL